MFIPPGSGEFIVNLLQIYFGIFFVLKYEHPRGPVKPWSIFEKLHMIFFTVKCNT